jgi:hypothetical protein
MLGCNSLNVHLLHSMQLQCNMQLLYNMLPLLPGRKLNQRSTWRQAGQPQPLCVSLVVEAVPDLPEEWVAVVDTSIPKF